MKAEWITDPVLRMKTAESILLGLPEWFGIEESTNAYIQECAGLDFCTVYDGLKPVGFAAVKIHFSQSAELAVMGLLPEYHRKKIGKRLILEVLQFCTDSHIKFLTVKTLAPSHPSSEYAGTRAFYKAMFFFELEVFPDLWDPGNPCLMMIRTVSDPL